MKAVACSVLVATCLCTASASAASIVATLDQVDADSWQASFDIANDLSFAIQEFTIYFDVNDYANLAMIASPTGWDSIVVQPDPLLPDDGFFDSLAENGGLAPSGMLDNFRVSFDFIGAGLPGSQFFEIVDPNDFRVLASGTTEAVVNVIPVPAAGVLLLSGLGVLGLRRRIGG